MGIITGGIGELWPFGVPEGDSTGDPRFGDTFPVTIPLARAGIDGVAGNGIARECRRFSNERAEPSARGLPVAGSDIAGRCPEL